jgi:hypothetical protein
LIAPINIKAVCRQIKYLLLGLILVFFIVPSFAQRKNTHVSHELKQFNKELGDADLTFTLPTGFKEIKSSGYDNHLFDYRIQLPDSDFEIWFQVKSLKPAKLKNDKQTNLDSLYLDMGRTQANAFVGDNNYMIRNIPQRALARYNADAGKTFLLNLPDSPTTKHYKYAMLVVLQKNHSGTLLATCFANELGPGFFKNLNMANSCIKFNQ